MNIIDLFSGGGGLTEGFKQQEYNILCHVEMDENACDSLKTREAYYYLKEHNQLHDYEKYLMGELSKKELYAMVPEGYLNKILNYQISHENLSDILGDIDELIHDFEIDGIIGGPPCQAYSTIGRARNDLKKETDERVFLYKYYSKFLEKYTPNFFIFENVKGLLSYKDFNDEKLLPKILKEFEDRGYDVDYRVLNTADYGVPQKRERLFIFGINSKFEYKACDFFGNLLQYREPSITVGELFQDLPRMQAGDTVNRYSKIPPSNFVTNNLRMNKNVLSQNIARPHNDRDKSIYRLVVQAKNVGVQLKYNELPKSLKTHQNEVNFLDRYKCLDKEGAAHTLVAHISKDGHYYIHPDLKQNRSISVREAARIQTFPDDYYFESSRTAAFKQIGNAVPVFFANKLAQTIKDIFCE